MSDLESHNVRNYIRARERLAVLLHKQGKPPEPLPSSFNWERDMGEVIKRIQGLELVGGREDGGGGGGGKGTRTAKVKHPSTWYRTRLSRTARPPKKEGDDDMEGEPEMHDPRPPPSSSSSPPYKRLRFPTRPHAHDEERANLEVLYDMGTSHKYVQVTRNMGGDVGLVPAVQVECDDHGPRRTATIYPDSNWEKSKPVPDNIYHAAINAYPDDHVDAAADIVNYMLAVEVASKATDEDADNAARDADGAVANKNANPSPENIHRTTIPIAIAALFAGSVMDRYFKRMNLTVTGVNAYLAVLERESSIFPRHALRDDRFFKAIGLYRKTLSFDCVCTGYGVMMSNKATAVANAKAAAERARRAGLEYDPVVAEMPDVKVPPRHQVEVVFVDGLIRLSHPTVSHGNRVFTIPIDRNGMIPRGFEDKNSNRGKEALRGLMIDNMFGRGHEFSLI